MLSYSIVIPVYNRPRELDELLDSLTKQTFTHFDVTIVEDGSTQTSESLCDKYQSQLDLHYYLIPNGGPGPARNYGALRCRGSYVIILDSDCIVPPGYLATVNRELEEHPVDAFGGPDRADTSFTAIQKAINYAMTSFFTTGGIRGGKKKLDAFYPRSFNMGIRTEVYRKLGGFAPMRYGEDIDFSIRIRKAGYSTRLFPEAYVYHKRRTNFGQFFRQVEHSGEARIALYKKYPDSLKLVHILPAVFVLGCVAILLASLFAPSLLWLFAFYAGILWLDAFRTNRGNIIVATLAVAASFTQLWGYGTGFLKAAWLSFR